MMKKLFPYLVWVFLCVSIFSDKSSVAEPLPSEPKLTIKAPGKSQPWVFTRSELLSRKDVQKVEITNDPSYPGRKMHYLAIPIPSLFKGIEISQDEALQFQCLDGFSAHISKSRLMDPSPNSPKAYLAIEPPDDHWPPLNPPDEKTAGPFALIWTYPNNGPFVREEWPYQIAGFEVKKSLQETFPKIFPDSRLAKNSAVQKGFQVYLRSCFACHTMNKQGESTLGPDLNIPHNPTEYMVPRFLKLLIRDPKQVRTWPSQKMHALPKEELSDADIDNVVAYLDHMKKRKQSYSHTTY